MVISAGSGSYSTRMSATAAVAASSVSAATAATASPSKRTLSMASTGVSLHQRAVELRDVSQVRGGEHRDHAGMGLGRGCVDAEECGRGRGGLRRTRP